MNECINGDLKVRVAIDTWARAWEPSPSASVWRKRLHRVGPPESGQVTSVVRYDRESSFAAHDHPDGEEILVLEGVFSDEHGDWPAGTYLLNPEGFRHAPFSREGCLLFVKLRQYPGSHRAHVVHRVDAMPWLPTRMPGRSARILYHRLPDLDAMRIERWAPGASLARQSHPQGAELFVLEGAFVDEYGHHPKHAWLRLPPGASHEIHSACGATVYIKTGGPLRTAGAV